MDNFKLLLEGDDPNLLNFKWTLEGVWPTFSWDWALRMVEASALGLQLATLANLLETCIFVIYRNMYFCYVETLLIETCRWTDADGWVQDPAEAPAIAARAPEVRSDLKK